MCAIVGSHEHTCFRLGVCKSVQSSSNLGFLTLGVRIKVWRKSRVDEGMQDFKRRHRALCATIESYGPRKVDDLKLGM